MTPDLLKTQRLNAALAAGELLPGNPLHQATLAGRPGYAPVYAPCCVLNQAGRSCRCPNEARVAVVRDWRKLPRANRRLFPPHHPFRLDA